MSGLTLCFDLMETIGKEVEKKRTRDYWIDLKSARRIANPNPVVQAINYIGGYGDGDRFGMFEALVDDIQDYIGDRWEEDPHFWENEQIATPSFIKGTYWKKMLAELEDW